MQLTPKTSQAAHTAGAFPHKIPHLDLLVVVLVIVVIIFVVLVCTRQNGVGACMGRGVRDGCAVLFTKSTDAQMSAMLKATVWMPRQVVNVQQDNSSQAGPGRQLAPAGGIFLVHYSPPWSSRDALASATTTGHKILNRHNYINGLARGAARSQ